MGMHENASVTGRAVGFPGGAATASAKETASGSPVKGRGGKRREIQAEEASRLLALGYWYLHGSADDPPPFEDEYPDEKSAPRADYSTDESLRARPRVPAASADGRRTLATPSFKDARRQREAGTAR
jgi:hypothetical protein